MERQVRDMLLFVKGDVSLTDTISIAELTESLAETMEAPLQQYKTQCQWDIEHIDGLLRCNKDALIGALLNLINNSLQAMPQGGLITISIKQSVDNTLLITITDTGSGIADNIQNKVEDIFFTTKSQGTGIGLSVVNAVAKSHGGTFSLSSIESDGVCASLCLPILTVNQLSAKPLVQPQVDESLIKPFNSQVTKVKEMQ